MFHCQQWRHEFNQGGLLKLVLSMLRLGGLLLHLLTVLYLDDNGRMREDSLVVTGQAATTPE